MTCISIGVEDSDENGNQNPGSLTWREEFLGFYVDNSSFIQLFTIFSHLTVAENENVMLVLGKLTYNPVTNVSRQYLERYKWAKGSGTFSPIGFVTVGTDIIFESSIIVASAADANLPNTVIRNLGNLSSTANYLDAINFNPEGVDLSDVTKTYLVQFIQDGTAKLYIFRGSESSQGFGIYGSGFLQAIESDFNEFADSGDIPGEGGSQDFEIKGIYANNTTATAAGLSEGDIYQLPAENDRSLLAVVTPLPEPEPPVFVLLHFEDIADSAVNMGVTELENAGQWNNAINSWSTEESNVNFTDAFVDENRLNIGGNNNSVTYLDLHQCGLKEVILDPLPNLEFLDISFNSIIPELYYSFWPNLTTAILNNNEMTHLNVAGNNSLINLICSFNKLTVVNVGTPSLEILEIQGNPLLSVINGLDQCSALQIVNASACSIGSFDGNALVSLQQLRIRDNQLSNLFLNNSPALTTLFAQQNNIDDFGPLELIKDGVSINLGYNLLPESLIGSILQYISDNSIMPALLDLSGAGNAPVTGDNLDLYNTLLGAGVNINCNT